MEMEVAGSRHAWMVMAPRTLGGVLAIIGGLLLATSAFLPWVTIGPGFVLHLPPVSSWDTVSGIEGDGTFFLVGDDGILFVVGGVLIAALGLWTILSRPRAAPTLLIVGGLGFGLLGWFEYKSIIEGFSDRCCDMSSFRVGEGIWWIYAGASATFLAGLVLIGQMKGAGVAEPAEQGSPAVRPLADQMT